MPRSNTILGIVLSFAVFVVVAGCVRAGHTAKVTGFTADVIDTDIHGKPRPGESKRKLYAQDHKSRQVFIEDGRVSSIYIGRRDTGVLWYIMPPNKQYIEQSAVYGDLIQDPSNIPSIRKRADVKELGTETANGYICRKIRITWHRKQMGVMTLWIAKKLDYSVRILMESKQSSGYIQLRNIKEQSVPDSMFELPRGYKKMPLPTKPGSARVPNSQERKK